MQDYSQLLPVIIILCIVILSPILMWFLFLRKYFKKLKEEDPFDKKIREWEEKLKKQKEYTDRQLGKKGD